MNTQIIAIANQKGGVGKTTTCANLGIGLAQAGKKVLLIDGDPQGSLTISLGNPQPDKLPFTLSDAMGRILMDEPLRPGEGILHHSEGVDLMPADIQLSGMEVSLVNAMSRETILRQYLDTLKGQYSHNPTIYLTTKGGGVPQEDRQALTDEQAERLLDAIRDLPPYVFVMIGLYAGLRREEILALQWDSVYLDTDTPYLTVRRAWHTEHNRPVISDELKTKAAERNIPLPVCLAECLKAAKETSTSEYVVSNRDGEPLSYTQFKRLWQYIVTRTVKERSYYRYEDGKRVKHTVTPVLGEKAAHNGKVVYSLDFEVTPHQLRHTYITNLIHASVDPKTVQYLAGHESSKITMDIYAKVKYNRPDELVRSMSCAFASWDTAQ